MAQSGSGTQCRLRNVRLFIDNAEQAHHLHVFPSSPTSFWPTRDSNPMMRCGVASDLWVRAVG